ncbi:Disulfide bond formation protein D precursor [Streptomyces sp. YIM 130001]|uniref:DsbA family protein n=1 Tax=Streptomyces sp. YIM 130001 TaxID=2259644 RepID=UPI000E64AAE6|nr:thioredoxin domain-containing protein [Streptomyces sp. YIM 130001]RII18344.1 Disulfide bond formation protein D precursor [Streptomyces sp. YIM 130001]
MSENNREGKRTARERLAAERERDKSRERRRRTLIVASAVVCVLGLAAVVGIVAANSGDDKKESAGPLVEPKGAAGKDRLAIPAGKPTAKSTLTIWEDFRCPACAQFETQYSPTINELADKGLLKVEYHLATIIDGNMGGTGSRNAANAAVCAQDAGRFPEYHDVLYKNQPQESDDAFAENDRLLELAGQVKGLETGKFKKCVEDGTYESWVGKSNEAFQKGGFRGTPTVMLDGKDIFADEKNPVTPQQLKQRVEAK